MKKTPCLRGRGLFLLSEVFHKGLEPFIELGVGFRGERREGLDQAGSLVIGDLDVGKNLCQLLILGQGQFHLPYPGTEPNLVDAELLTNVRNSTVAYSATA